MIYDKEKIQKQLKKFKDLISSITTEQNQERLERFTLNISKISHAKEKMEKFSKLLELLSKFKLSFDKQIKNIDEALSPIDISNNSRELQSGMKGVNDEFRRLQNDNEKIRKNFEEVYSGDLTGLLENAEAYRNSIEKLNARLESISIKEVELKEACNDLEKIPKIILKELERIKNAIDQRWKKINEGHETWTKAQSELMKKILSDRNIKLEGQIIFDAANFLQQLKGQLNLRSFRATAEQTQDERIVAEFKVHDAGSYLEFMKQRLYEIQFEPFVSGDLAKVFHNLSSRSKYLRVEPVITYDGRPLENLSVGQKGTVYLCLKLATQSFVQPLIFDQPEDDLDNEFIIEELVEIFKSIKRYRQVILVTHNANLVVNADSEQVIVSSNDGGVIKYESGSLENGTINKHVRRVLEGGDNAFKKREQRYNLTPSC